MDSIRRDRDPSAFTWTYHVCTGEANQLKQASSRHLGSDADRGVIWPDSGRITGKPEVMPRRRPDFPPLYGHPRWVRFPPQFLRAPSWAARRPSRPHGSPARPTGLSHAEIRSCGTLTKAWSTISRNTAINNSSHRDARATARAGPNLNQFLDRHPSAG